MSQSFSKPSGFLKYLSWACFVCSGWITWVNAKYTAEAYIAAGLPAPLPHMAALIYTVVQSAVFAYLFAPEIWSEVCKDFFTEAGMGMGTSRGLPRWIAATLLSLRLVIILGASVAAIWADWQSTFDYLDLKITGSFDDVYVGAIAITLVIGSEVLMIAGYQVWRLARLHGINQAVEASNMNPAWVHAQTQAKYNTKAAQAQAKAAAEQWGQPR